MKVNNPTIPKFPIIIINNEELEKQLTKLTKQGYIGYGSKQPMKRFNRMERDFPVAILLHNKEDKTISILLNAR